MNQSEARRYVAEQIGGDPVQLVALLDRVDPSTLAQWHYIAGQYGHASAQELRDRCVGTGAVTTEQV